MISPALMLSWMWGKKRKPLPEYQSPNSWSDYYKKSNKCLQLQDELTKTFTHEQGKLYEKYRESVLEASRAEPWQYSQLLPTPTSKEK